MADRNDAALREHLVKLLTRRRRTPRLMQAVKGLKPELRGKVPKGAEHSPWQLAGASANCAVGHCGVFAECEIQVAEVA